MKVNFLKLWVSSILLGVASQCYAVTATPTQYTVTLQDVSFHRVGTSSDSFLPYAAGSGNFDIAAASAGSTIGNLPSGNPLSPGEYNQMRFSVSKTMTITGSANVGYTCRTVTGGARIVDPFGDGSVSVAYLGTSLPGSPEPEVVEVPSGSAVVLPSGYVDTGTAIQGTVDVSMTVQGSVPEVTAEFDVANAIQFEDVGGGQCVVFPGPPVINVSTD